MYSINEIPEIIPSVNIDLNRSKQTGSFTNRSWFSNFFGVSETDLTHESLQPDGSYGVLSHLIRYDKKTGILHTPKGNHFAGWFIAPSVEEIISTIQNIKPKSGRICIKFVRNQSISEYISQQKESGRIYQAASQFNALEMINPSKTPSEGITGYIYDRTQGPAVALTSVAGTYVRNYYIPSILGRQFNALKEIGLSHTNGYLLWGNNPHITHEIIKNGKINKLKIPATIFSRLDGLYSGLHSVMYERCDSEYYNHQIYTSAVPVDTYGNHGDSQIQDQIAHLFLLAAYKGVIGLGIILHHYEKQFNLTTRQRPLIDLCLIGTGAFNNRPEIVINSLNKAILFYEGYDIDLNIHVVGESNWKALNCFKLHRYPSITVEYTREQFSSIHKYLMAVQNWESDGHSFFNLLEYQQEMLNQISNSSNDRISFYGYDRDHIPVIADVYKKFTSDGKVLYYYKVDRGGKTGYDYFIEIAQYTLIEKIIPEQHYYNLYSKKGQINKWNVN